MEKNQENQEKIILTQEWIETHDDWFTIGFNEPLGYVLEKELDWDKHFRCIKGLFKLENEK